MYSVVLILLFLYLYNIKSQCTIDKKNAYLALEQELVNEIKCEKTPIALEIDPPLPTGFTFDSKTKKFGGKYQYPLFNTTFLAKIAFEGSVTVRIYFSIAVYGVIKRCSFGNNGTFIVNVGQFVNINGPRCDSPVYRFGISPSLPNGLNLNNITGKITGSSKTPLALTNYVVTPYVFNESIVTFHLNIQFKIVQPVNLPEGLYSRYTPDGYCSNLTGYSIFSKFDSGIVPIANEGVVPYLHGTCFNSSCDWDMNINRRHRLYFCMKSVGYITINSPGEYTFSLEADESAFLFIDNFEKPIIELLNKTGRAQLPIQLGNGYHKIGLLYQQSSGPYHLRLEWKSSVIGESDFARIGKNYFRYDPVPLQNLHYISSHILFVKGTYRYFKPTIEGTPTVFKLQGAPPPGVTFIASTGVLAGTPTEIIEDYRTVTVIAESSTSSCNVSLSFKVLELIDTNMIHGVHSEFYRPISYSCDVAPDLNDGKFTLVERLVEQDVTHEVSMYPFENLALETSVYVIKMYGSLYIPVSRQYTFKLISNDGSTFSINGSTLNNWGCKNFGVLEKEMTKILDIGYYYYEVLYLYTPDRRLSGVELFWDYPIGESNLIPQNFYYYVPLGTMEYTEGSGKYYREKKYPLNNLIKFSPPSRQIYINFRIYPNLPSGLKFNTNNGSIEGTVLGTYQGQTSYMITSETYDKSSYVTTTLTLEIETSSGLSDLYYINQELKNTTILNGNIGVKISELSPQYSGEALAFEVIYGNLPLGIELDRLTGIISGTPVEQYNSSVRIAASNAIGSVSMILYIDIIGCKTEEYFFLFGMYNFDADINIKVTQDNVELYTKQITKNFELNSYSKCIVSNKNVKVDITSKAFREPIFEIKKSGDTYIFYGLLPPYDGITDVKYSNEFSLAEADPKLEIGNLTVYNGIYFESYAKITGGVSKIISIDPALPEGLIFMVPGIITGLTTTLTAKKSYKVTYENNKSIQSTEFNLEVVNCDGDNIGFIFTVKTEEDGYNMIVKLQDASDNKVLFNYNGFLNYSTTIYSFCRKQGNYKLTLDSVNKESWQLYSYIDITLLNTINVLNEKYIKGSTNDFIVDLAHTISMYKQVKYYGSGSAPDNWYNPSTTVDWKYGTTGTFPDRTQTTQYYRYDPFSVTNYNQISSIILGIRHDAGIVLYLNGKEIFRINLPSGPITQNTLATKKYDTIQYIRYTLSPTHLLATNNVLCVETHKHELSTNMDLFGLYLDVNEFECSVSQINRYLYGDVTTTHQDEVHHPISYLFDDDPSTQWVTLASMQPGTTVTYKYHLNSLEFANTYVVVSGDDMTTDPTSWKLFCYTQGSSERIQLDQQQYQTYTDRQYRHTYYFTNNISCHTFEWAIISHGDFKGNLSPNIAVADFLLYACKTTFCPVSNEWKPTKVGHTVKRPCPIGYEGYTTRKCLDNGVWEAVQSSCIKKAPGTILFQGNPTYDYEFSRRLSIDTMSISCSDAADIIFTIDPPLPKGLNLNATSGKVSGIPQEVSEKKQYTATAKNDVGTSTGTFSIVITQAFCPDTGVCIHIEQGDSCYEQCPAGQVGVISTLCKPSWVPYWDEPVSGCETDTGKSKSGLSTGVVVVIVIVVLAAVVVLGVVGYKCFAHRKGPVFQSTPGGNTRRPDSYTKVKD